MLLDAAQPFLLANEAPPPPPAAGITPRDYQLAGIAAARNLIAESIRRILLVLATGGGKTVVAALVALGAVQKGKRILFVGPRREIIAQAFWKLVEVGIPETSCGVVMADGVIPHVSTRRPYNARRPQAPVQVASIQTLANRRLPPADVVFIDEAHHATSATWAKVIEHYTEAGAVVVGLTATPCRADGAGLGKLFDRLHVIASFADLAAQGFLVTPRVFTTPHAPDLSKVKVNRAGEYDATQVATVMRDRALVGDIVTHWQKLAEGRTTVVFAASVEHSRELCEAFRAAGTPAGHIDALTPPDERDATLTALARGEITVLCNMGVCLDAETEVLTSAGWVGIDAMTEDHLVANWDDGHITFEKPQGIIRRERASGERMVRFAGARLDVRVTEDHELLYRTVRGGKFLKKRARELVGRRCELPVSGVAAPLPVPIDPEPALAPERRARRIVQLRHLLKKQGMPAQDVDTEAARRVDRMIALRRKAPAELTLDECRFIGFWVGDGTATRLARGGVEYTITQSERYPQIIAWLDALVDRMGIGCVRKRRRTTSGHPTPFMQRRWSFPRGTGGGPQEREGLYGIEPYLAKDGSPLWWGLNVEQFAALLEGLWLADGDHGDGAPLPGNRAMRITIASPGLRDCLQAIAVARGFGCNWHLASTPHAYPNAKPLWRFAVRPKSAFTMGNDRFAFEDGWAPERVWCVRVRTGNIITRRGGHALVMGNCTEGWDLPRCKCVVLARPTKSLSLFLQMCGRGLRPWQDVSALLLDHAGAVHEHGFPSDPREWSLDGKVKRAAAVAVRTCPECYAALPAGTVACSECGHVFETEERPGLEVVDGELVETAAAPKPSMEARVAFYDETLREGLARGRKVGWCRHRYRERFGMWPAGPRLVALERMAYPRASVAELTARAAALLSPEMPAEPPALFDVPDVADPWAPAPTPEPAPVPAAPPPRRARRLSLDALFAPPVPVTTAPEVESWVL